MGNAESKYRPYICLLKQLLKKGKHKTSEKKVEELFKVIETHCSWFPDLGTFDLDQWENVRRDLHKLHSNGVSLPDSIWETWELVHLVLEPLQTDSEEEETEGEIEDQMGEREDGEDEDKESEIAPTVVPKSLYPNLGDCLKDNCPPPKCLSHLPSPPPPFGEQTSGPSRSVV
ncbi:hypothetical protein mRhiFer1_008393 [Rhinolophus ferrumequinum]|uniref:Beta-retroviral matrix protein domain-containing protein n=1 Tax=Rhinolophus ferrumequinum TaxID=59479 RepID=A0A7J7VEM2_RHIFE|nr:hypothetical protein mRhiFer1_008393 [Rhinolophus ferrumequinum]